MRRARRMTRLSNDRLLLTNDHCSDDDDCPTCDPVTKDPRVYNMLMSRIKFRIDFHFNQSESLSDRLIV